MNTAPDGKGNKPPQLKELLGAEEGGTAKDQAIAALQEQTTLRRHAPGWIGILFGGQVNAATNIIGAVAILALLMIAVFGFAGNAAAAIEVAKATLFLSIGYFTSKKIDSNSND